MSVTAVPGAAADVLSDTPVAGGVDQIDAVGSFIADVRLDAWTFAATMSIVRQSLQGMEASAVTTVDAKIGEALIPGSSALQESADIAKQAFDAYAAEVARIHSDAQNLRVSVEECLGSIRSQAGEIEAIARTIGVSVWYAWETAPPAQMPEPRLGPAADALPADERQAAAQTLHGQYGTRWLNASSFWQTGIEGVGAARTAWANLIEDRRLAENALIAALETTPVGQLMSVGGGGAGSRRFTIAAGIAGELWGASTKVPGVEKLPELLDGSLPPEDVARVWAQLQQEGVDTERLLREYCFELAALDGLPFSAMDAAGRAALAYALDAEHPENLSEAFIRLGFAEGERSIEDFRTDLQAVQDALDDAADLATESDTVQLVSLGRHDGAVTAGISLGDLDSASTVGVFVSGMNSDVRSIADALDAFHSIRRNNIDMAMVTWVGYHAPNIPEEAFQMRADSGSRALASFLDGMAVQRADDPISRLVVLGHSYGTNVGAEALKITKASVDAFVTLGSAGLTYGTTAESLGVEEIHATHADGDNIAQTLGRYVHFRTSYDGGGLYRARVDPRDLEGAHVFSSGNTAEGEAVTMHNLVEPMDWGVMQGLADSIDGTAADDEVGYLNARSSTVKELGKIMRDEG